MSRANRARRQPPPGRPQRPCGRRLVVHLLPLRPSGTL